jgi:hypothetical protein
MHRYEKPWPPTKSKMLLTIVYGHQWNGSGKHAKGLKINDQIYALTPAAKRWLIGPKVRVQGEDIRHYGRRSQ